MPNKRTFDLALLVVLLAAPAKGLVKIAARRWSNEGQGRLALVGDVVKVSL